MSNEITQDIVLEKKLDCYGRDMNDFYAPGEITVTITLGEYRDLVKKNATTESRIEAVKADKYERDAENKKLKEENLMLKEEVYNLKKELESVNGVVPESATE